MPGQPFLYTSDSYQGVAGEGVPAANPAATGSHTAFLIWLVVLGVVVPALILGGLRAGGFQFVFKRR
jgi:hypothetical protein